MGYCSLRNRRKLKTMNKAKFKIGDRLYHNNKKCVVMDILSYNQGKYKYQIVYDEDQTSQVPYEDELYENEFNPMIYHELEKPILLNSFERLLKSLNLTEQELSKSCIELIGEYRQIIKILEDYEKGLPSDLREIDIENLEDKIGDLENLIVKKIKWLYNNKHTIEFRKENLMKGKMEKANSRKLHAIVEKNYKTLKRFEKKIEGNKLSDVSIKKRGRPRKNPNEKVAKVAENYTPSFDNGILLREIHELKEMVEKLTNIVIFMANEKKVDKSITNVKESIPKNVLQEKIDNMKVGQKKTINGYHFKKIEICVQNSKPSGKDFHIIEMSNGNKKQVQVYRLS